MPRPCQPSPLWQHDQQILGAHPALIGVDEAGRGALAGPVVAAAVFCPAAFYLDASLASEAMAIHDSKQVKARERETLAQVIESWHERALIRVSWACADVAEIEQFNILGATRLAMQRALEALAVDLLTPATEELPLFPQAHAQSAPLLLVDGRPLRPFPYTHRGLIQGDGHSFCIAAASIVAKVRRDALMTTTHTRHPLYGFAQHKGYGTTLHYEAIRQHGPADVHRPSFLRKMAG